jgi:HlyD family secretion protein
MDLESHLSKSSPPKPRTTLLTVIGGGVVFLAVALLIGWYRRDALTTVDGSALVVDSVKQGDLVVKVDAPGTLVPIDKIFLSSYSAGVVEKVNLRAGAPLQKGTVIVELSNTEVSSRAKDAELALNVALAEFEQLRQQTLNDEISSRSRLAQVQAQFSKAAIDLEAARELAASGLVPRLDLRKMELSVEQLRSRKEIDEQFNESLPALNRSKIKAKDARVRQLQEARRYFDDLVSKLRVTSEIDGVLQSVAVEQGQRITEGTEIAGVAYIGSLKAELRVEEGLASQIGQGQSAKLRINGQEVEGGVTRVNPAVKEGTVTVDVKSEGPLPDFARAEMRVDGTIEVGSLKNVLYLGRPAGLPTNGSASLFVVEGGVARRRSVTIGRRTSDAVEVLKGLSLGERVVISDTSRFAERDSFQVGGT